jgi:hypothetical protein
MGEGYRHLPLTRFSWTTAVGEGKVVWEFDGTTTVTRLDNWRMVVRFLAGAGVLPLLQNMQTSSQAHPVSYSVDMGSSFTGVKADREWNWTLTSIQCRVWECMELCHHSPIWLHGVRRDSFTITFSGAERMDGFRWCLAYEEKGIRHRSDNTFMCTFI